MNRSSGLLLLTITLGNLITACSDETQNKAELEKYAAFQAEKAKHKSMPAAEMAEHSSDGTHHSMPMPSESASAHQNEMDDIGRRADDLPVPLNRTQPQLVSIDLYSDEVVAEMMPGVTYQYWTYNGKVPGPFIRARVGDQVEINLSHGKPGATGATHSEHTSDQHAAAGHSAHSIDLHAVIGPGGGAPLM
ncbi:MAG: multicopper oxidase domain-containing protein, partial [Methylobacter sp.]